MSPMKNLLLLLAFCSALTLQAQDLVRFSNGSFYQGETEIDWLEFENLITSAGLSPKTFRKAIRNLHQSEYPVQANRTKLGIAFIDYALVGATAMSFALELREPSPAAVVVIYGATGHMIYTLCTLKTKMGYYRKGFKLAQEAVEEYNTAVQLAP